MCNSNQLMTVFTRINLKRYTNYIQKTLSITNTHTQKNVWKEKYDLR